MVFNQIVEVAAVSVATQASTGKKIYSVKFAVPTPVDEELKKCLPQQPIGAKHPAVIYYDTIIMFFDFDKTVPYKVGSKWELSIKESGELSLKEVK